MVIIADTLIILVLLRNRTSYFRPYRLYFLAIYGLFLYFPFREIIVTLAQSTFALRLTSQLIVVAAISIALLWGHLATKLYMYPVPFSLRRVFTRPRAIVHYVFLLYTVPMVTVLLAAFFLPSSFVEPTGRTTDLLSGAVSPAPGMSDEFLVIGLSVIVAFVGYPLMVFVRLRSQLKDPEVRNSLRLIASTFGTISVLIFLVLVLDRLTLNWSAPIYLACVGLLGIVDRAFSRPSFLKAFLGLVPALESRYTGKRPDMRAILYKKDDEKFGPIARFVSEGIDQDGLVAYFHLGDAVLVREGLARQGLAWKQPLMRRNLRFAPFSSLYEDDETITEEATLTYVSGLASEARALGKKNFRIVVDYGDRAMRPYNKFVNHLADPRWTSQDHYVWVLMAFSENAFQGQESALALLKSKIDTLDLSDVVDTFSRTVGFSHSDIFGKKILLEYDPQSDYERILKSVLSESYSNFERSVLFTRRDSPLYSALGEQTGAKMFLLTPRVSYPRMEEENRVLLPAYDSSLMLDALNRTLQAYAGASLTIVFDSISHFVFTLGVDRAVSLVRQAMELMISSKITAVFLVNGGAHDPKTISSFENLFDMEIVCNPGARVPQVKRSLPLETSR